MNISDIKHFPRWYIVNDLCIVLFNLIIICMGMTFVILIIRERKLRTIMNILSSNSCSCGSLLALTFLWDAFYMLRTDTTGLIWQDESCVTRAICMLITMTALNYSLCIQTYHRFVSIVHFQQSSLRSKSLYIRIIILQWFVSLLLILPIIQSRGIVYQIESFVCRISFSNTSLFTYLFIISYGIPILFIIILHLFIARYIKKYWKFHRQRHLSNAYLICPYQRIVLMILVLILSGSPYEIFFILEHLHVSIVPYAQKIGMAFSSLSFALTMISIFGFNRSVRNSFSLLFYRTD